MLLIGSHALKYRDIDTGRRPLDVDLIATFDELQALTVALRRRCRVASHPLSANKTVLKCAPGMIVEVELAWPGTSAAELLAEGCVWAPVPSVLGLDAVDDIRLAPQVASLDVLYSLKMSHRYLKNSPHFRKTRDDIMLMRKAGAKLLSAEWMQKREDETYWYKHPKLNVMKGDFFKGDGVQYVYDHDDIHKAVAHLYDAPFASYEGPPKHAVAPKVPAYTLYMRDGAEVQCSKKKFFDASEQVRLYGVLEEAQVLALERSQIPHRGKVTPRRSFDMALMKVCTSITSGWFREFAWENFDRVEGMYEADYVDRFWKAVDDGRVRKLDATATD